MKKLTLRLTALLLALLLLAGCGRDEPRRSNRDKDSGESEPVVTEAQQKEMPQAEKEAALRRMEYALLCAAIDSEDRMKQMEGFLPDQTVAYVGDYNGDGAEDLICGRYSHTFDALNHQTTYTFSQSGFDYYTDKDGTLYRRETIGDSYENNRDGVLVMENYWEEWFWAWDGTNWAIVLSQYESSTQEIIQDEEGYFLRYGRTLEESAAGQIGEQVVTPEEYEAHVQQIGLAEMETRAADFTRLSFDEVYAEDLLAAIWDQLGGIYGLEMVTGDYDGDGQEENFYFFSTVGSYWFGQTVYSEFQDSESGRWQFKDIIDVDRDQRCVLIADREDGKLNITAGCIPRGFSVYQGMNIRMDGGFLWFDSMPLCLPGQKPQTDPAWFGNFVRLHGYDDCLVRAVDLSDLPGNEYLCLAQKGGVWYAIVIVLIDGTPRVVMTRDLANAALYLTEKDGKQCLLIYGQYVRTLWDGNIETAYDYSVMRFDEDGNSQSLDYQYHSYTADEPDATATAAFFDKLNVYIIKIVVIRDPFRLTGRMWMLPDGWSGNIPAEPEQEQPTEQPESQMGFVQINDPGSWLNLRQGPGTEYPLVLMDPNDPESFVKQALGSPVTILETIETGDAQNPVWVKIRITYADREIVGYSSRRYIRVAGE